MKTKDEKSNPVMELLKFSGIVITPPVKEKGPTLLGYSNQSTISAEFLHQWVMNQAGEEEAKTSLTVDALTRAGILGAANGNNQWIYRYHLESYEAFCSLRPYVEAYIQGRTPKSMDGKDYIRMAVKILETIEESAGATLFLYKKYLTNK